MLAWRFAGLVGFILVLGGHGMDGQATQAAPAETRAIKEIAVKEILGARLESGFLVRAEVSALTQPAPADWARLGPGSAAIEAKVRSLASAPGAAPAPVTAHTSEEFREGTLIVPSQQVQDLIRSVPTENNSYPALRARYQVLSVISLSAVVMTDDGRDAFVRYSHGCGSLCGTIGYVWLHRDTPTAPWVAKRLATAGA